jgi:hypothetical protein
VTRRWLAKKRKQKKRKGKESAHRRNGTRGRESRLVEMCDEPLIEKCGRSAEEIKSKGETRLEVNDE